MRKPKRKAEGASFGQIGTPAKVSLAGVILLLVLVSGLLVAGSQPRKIAETVRTPKRLFVIVIDISLSTKFIRNKLIDSVDETGTSLSEADDLVIISLGSSSSEVFSGMTPDPTTLKRILESLKPDQKGGSDYTGAYGLAADAIDRTKATRAVVLIAGDGGRNGLNAHVFAVDQAHKAAARKIANNPKVSQVRFFGASSNPSDRVREDIRWAFEGLDDQTLRILRSDERPWPEAW